MIEWSERVCNSVESVCCEMSLHYFKIKEIKKVARTTVYGYDINGWIDGSS